jgi:hypothetical protein
MQYTNSVYSICFWVDTAGGFVGYLSAGTMNNTNHMIPTNTSALFLLFELNNEDLLYTNIIPNSAAIEVSKTVPAIIISPPFCHMWYCISSSESII